MTSRLLLVQWMKSVHSFVDLEEDRAIGEVGVEGVFVHERSGEELGWEADIFGTRKWGAEVEVGDVGGHEVGIVRDNRVKKNFDDVEVGGARRHVTRVVNFVTASGAADTAHPHTHLHFFAHLGVVVRCVGQTIARLVVTVDGLDRVRVS